MNIYKIISTIVVMNFESFLLIIYIKGKFRYNQKNTKGSGLQPPPLQFFKNSFRRKINNIIFTFIFYHLIYVFLKIN